MNEKISVAGFEATMMEMFHEGNPLLLDDELPDAFSDWVSTQTLNEIGEMAEVYCYKMEAHKDWKELRDAYWVQNFGPLPTQYDQPLIK